MTPRTFANSEDSDEMCRKKRAGGRAGGRAGRQTDRQTDRFQQSKLLKIPVVGWGVDRYIHVDRSV